MTRPQRETSEHNIAQSDHHEEQRKNVIKVSQVHFEPAVTQSILGIVVLTLRVQVYAADGLKHMLSLLQPTDQGGTVDPSQMEPRAAAILPPPLMLGHTIQLQDEPDHTIPPWLPTRSMTTMGEIDTQRPQISSVVSICPVLYSKWPLGGHNIF